MNTATMPRLTFEAYRALHEQGFVPIFTEDGADARRLVEAAVEVGCRVIEYTLRRRDADRMIPWIRKNFPELYLLVGSTLEDAEVVRKQRRWAPQLRTLDELAEMGVHGFVSMIGYRPETIRRLSSTHVVLSSAMTLTEAYQAAAAGAHFVKITGPALTLVRTCRAEPTHGFCPLFVTGGQLRERIPDTIAAGGVLVGTGTDLLLKEGEGIREALRGYLEVTRAARQKHWPQLAHSGTEDRAWLESLPHYHPF